MPAAPGSNIPDLRLHRPTGQAVVRLVNPRGGRRDYYGHGMRHVPHYHYLAVKVAGDTSVDAR